jgi:hypothetical protein
MEENENEHRSPYVTRGYKHRINQFFRLDDATRIREATEYVHAVMGNATLLIKYRLIKFATDPNRDRDGPPMMLNEADVLNAVRAVQYLPPATKTKDGKKRALEAPVGTRARVRKVHRSDTAVDVPSTSTPEETTAEDKVAMEERIASQRDERQDRNDAWLSDYREMTADCLEPVLLGRRGWNLSVSHVFGNAAKQYVAAVVANVRYHFRSYVCRSLGIVLRSKICALEGVKRFKDLSSRSSRHWRAEMGKAYDDVLFHRTGQNMKTVPEMRVVVERHRSHLVPPLPPRKRCIDDDLDSSTRPFVYLGYMIRMTAFVEASGGTKGLFSPIPLKTSHIPAHYTFDTSSIAHLLMDGKRIDGFKRFFEHSVSGGYPLPGLKDKSSLLASLERQRGADKGGVTAVDEELYLDAIWTYLAYFKNRRTKVTNPLYPCGKNRKENGGLSFGHSISTDGYSVTLLATNQVTRGRKHVYQSGASSRKRVPEPTVRPGRDKDGFLKLSAFGGTDYVKEELQKTGFTDPNNALGGDPGKGVLLLLQDGKGNTLRYTCAQRRHETCQSNHADKVKMCTRRVHFYDVLLPSRRSGEGQQKWKNMNTKKLEGEQRVRRLSMKTCDQRRMRTYVAYREACRPTLEATYTANTFRALRFLAWCRRDESIQMFVEEIKKKYGTRPSHKPGTSDDNVVQSPPIVIFYGDWGRRPNLKNQAPSPGIGLRRLLEASEGIVTVTVHEAYTSSYCPNCEGPVSEGRGKHGLLKCDHTAVCGTYWSRDVLGALNIRTKGLHLWNHAKKHPLFGG